MDFNPDWMPGKSIIRVYRNGSEMHRHFQKQKIDLADTIMLKSYDDPTIVEMTMTTKTPSWVAWDEDTIGRVEAFIAYDLGYDGYKVDITRVSGMDKPCVTEMRWRLSITQGEPIENEED